MYYIILTVYVKGYNGSSEDKNRGVHRKFALFCFTLHVERLPQQQLLQSTVHLFIQNVYILNCTKFATALLWATKLEVDGMNVF